MILAGISNASCKRARFLQRTFAKLNNKIRTILKKPIGNESLKRVRSKIKRAALKLIKNALLRLNEKNCIYFSFFILSSPSFTLCKQAFSQLLPCHRDWRVHGRRRRMQISMIASRVLLHGCCNFSMEHRVLHFVLHFGLPQHTSTDDFFALASNLCVWVSASKGGERACKRVLSIHKGVRSRRSTSRKAISRRGQRYKLYKQSRFQSRMFLLAKIRLKAPQLRRASLLRCYSFNPKENGYNPFIFCKIRSFCIYSCALSIES